MFRGNRPHPAETGIGSHNAALPAWQWQDKAECVAARRVRSHP